MPSSPILENPSKAKTARRFSRQKVESLVYVDLGSENGGFPNNISEDGMCFQGIRPLKANQQVRITFKLDGMDEPISVMAKVVWLTESRKGGALQFIDLPEASRQQIRNWILQQKQLNSSKEDSKASVSRAKGRDLRAPGAPSAPVKAAPAAPADAVVAKPTPSPLLPASSTEAYRSIPPKISSNTDPGARKSLQSKYTQAMAELQRAAQTPAPLPKGKGVQPVPVTPSAPNQTAPQASASDAIVAAPPSPSQPAPAVEASQPVPVETAPRTEPEAKKSMPSSPAEISADLQQSSEIPVSSLKDTEIQSSSVISTPIQSTPPVNLMIAQPSSSLPSDEGQALQPVAAENALWTEQDDKNRLPLKSSDSPMDLQRFLQIPAAAPVVVEKKHGRSIVYGLGLAASIAIIIAGGVILWPYRGALHSNSSSNNNLPAAAAIESASAQKPAPPQEQAPAAEPARELAAEEPSQPAPALVPEAQENLTPPPAPNVPVSAPSRAAVLPAPVAPKINRVATPTPVVPATSEVRPSLPASSPAVAPTRSEQATPPPPPSRPAVEAVNEPPVPSPVAASAKIAPPEVKPAPAPMIPTGSVEIIPDPYPSIRMPAAPPGRAPQSTASLQIGRLVSKIEPIYPPDALRQRSAARVKVHIFIGRSGAIEGAQLVDGPTQFADAALRAIEQWHFEPTMLGGTAIEVEEDVTVVFRIISPSSPAN